VSIPTPTNPACAGSCPLPPPASCFNFKQPWIRYLKVSEHRAYKEVTCLF
jgi:hypothetical protein